MNTENNRLIREFLGTDEITASIPFTYYLGEELPTSGNICTLDSVEDEIRLEIEEGIINEVDVSIEILEYHNDWNELMKVVEKIEEFNYDFQIMGGCWVIIKDVDPDRDEFDEIIEVSEESKIKTVYTACVEFIKWYNEQKQ